MKIDVVIDTSQAARDACLEAWRICQSLTLAGKRVHIKVGEAEDNRSLQQNKFYWGVLLKETSEQARVGNKRYTIDAWHEFGKRQFLGFELKKVDVAGRRKVTVIRRLRSTKDLTVKRTGAYLDEFIAYASVDLGVMFSSKSWMEYRT